jgi:rhodanese-related sulfurtransferase/uncharacterized membrane protein YedE/YeeE
MAPLYKFGFFDHGASLVVAVVIGMAFGFFLERGGLGNSRKLAAQFYLTDLTVFKVMFTAILTAGVGLYLLAWLGIVDLAYVYLNPTYLIPQLLAGLLFGVGFITAGLCPGTAVVSVATGKLDGLMTLVGILIGIAVFAELFPLLEPFYYSTSLGQVSLSQLLPLSPGGILLLVVLVALAGFVGAEALENRWSLEELKTRLIRFRGKPGLNGKLALGILILTILLAFTPRMHYPLHEVEDSITIEAMNGQLVKLIGVHEMAERLMESRAGDQVLDTRSRREYERYHLPSADHLPEESPDEELAIPGKAIFVYSTTGKIPSSILDQLVRLNPDSIYVLKGGLERWRKSILFPDLSLSGIDDEERERLKQVSRYFGGDPFIREEDSSSGSGGFLREGC